MLSEGSTVDRYEVVSRLASGGMADVLVVRHVTLGTLRALKVLRHATPQLRERLLREGRAQASLDHPNIVRVLDVIEADDDPALVMELVDGPSLDQLITQDPLPVDRVSSLLHQIVLGLDAAHRGGVIHRDLKPGNVLVDQQGRARITDFGLAALMDQPDRAGARLTRPNATLGTPAYMAPEQYSGAADVDARADVWALGVLAYELCTGVTPMEGLPIVAGWHRMAEGHWRPLDQVRPDLPERMGMAVAWALRPDRQERCPSALDFWAAFSGREAVPPPTALPATSIAARPTRDTWVPSAPPSIVRDLLGRDAELAAAWDRLTARGGLVSLVGTGGVGKSRLAAELCARWADERRALWVDLEPARTEDDVVHRTGFALGDVGDGSARAVGVALARVPTLLVLDNLEQLPQRPVQKLVQDWLIAAPSLRILATSRQALGIGLEQVVELSPLPVSGDGDVRELAAWKLLVAAAPAGTLDRVDAELAARLIGPLDGLPLALELAAARLEVLEPAELAERLESRLDILADPDAPNARHGALRNAIGWSWSLLQPPEQQALAALSVFRAPFPLKAAEAVVGPRALDALHGLVRRHLVSRTKGRFSLLASIREYAAEHLSDEACALAWRAHAAWVTDALRAIDGTGGDPRVIEALEALSTEVWAVVTRARGRADLGVAAWRAAHGLLPLYRMRGPATALEALTRAALAIEVDLPPDERRPLETSFHTMRGLALRHTGQLEEAEAAVRAALVAAGEAPSSHRAVALAHVADLALELGRGSPEAYEEVVAMAEAHGPRHLVRTAAAALATLVVEDRERAERAWARSEAAADPDDLASELGATKDRAWILMNQERLAEAREAYEVALELATRIGQLRSMAYVDGQLGLIAELLGDIGGALPHLDRVIAYMSAQGDQLYECWYRWFRARVLVRSNRFEEAATDARAAAELAPGTSPAEDATFLADALALRAGRPARSEAPLVDALRGLYAAHRASDRTALTDAVARVRAALADEPRPTPEVYEHLLREVSPEGWRFAADGSWFEDPGGARTDSSRHAANARILAHLVGRRVTEPGSVADVAELAAVGWPGEKIVARAAGNRVRVALSALRALGLEPLVQRDAGGWRFDPDQLVIRA
ncbi:MAG: protein kinase [Alphaproteobacteria bacterium]|nr:protein kinase [Alphaproteobacteria bacterium]